VTDLAEVIAVAHHTIVIVEDTPNTTLCSLKIQAAGGFSGVCQVSMA
jgi:hypothetical protein